MKQIFLALTALCLFSTLLFAALNPSASFSVVPDSLVSGAASAHREFKELPLLRNQECPNITLSGSSTAVSPDEVMRFYVKSENAPDLKYAWVVDRGKIASGKDTSSIAVDVSGLKDSVITATVKIEGLPDSCPNTFSEIGIVETPSLEPSAEVDEKGLKSAGSLIKLVGIAIKSSNNDPNSTSVIVTYGKKEKVVGQTNKIKTSIKLLQYDASRIRFVWGGDSDAFTTELFVVPVSVNDFTHGNLAGTVRSEKSRQPLADINVELMFGGKTVAKKVTNKEGIYNFTGITAVASYEIKVAGMGKTRAIDTKVNKTVKVPAIYLD